MIVVCSGSRDWSDTEAVTTMLSRYDRNHDVLLEGGHRVHENLGVPTNREMVRSDVSLDAIVYFYGRAAGFDVVTYSAPWNRLGNYAGPHRNIEMLRLAQILAVDKGVGVAVELFPLPDSKGTRNMEDLATEEGLPVNVHLPGLKEWTD